MSQRATGAQDRPARADAMAAGRGRNFGYQPALDGVRGLAILGVLLLHTHLWGAMPGFAPGGHLGVTVFFVLSGYLISTLLLAEHDKTGQIDMRAFYLRRGARLMPALLLFIPIHTLIWASSQSPWELALTVIPAVLYLTSVVHAIWASMGPLSWTWSLSVEEHFYAGWPPLVRWLLDGPGRIARGEVPGHGLRGWMRRHPLVTAGLAATVLVAIATGARVVLLDSVRWHDVLYYSTLTRMDAIAVGCLAALYGWRYRLPMPNLLGWLGIAALAYGYATYRPGTPALNLVGLPLTDLATALVVLGVVASPAGSLAKVLSVRPLVHLGAVSYGVYLWNLLPGQAYRMIFDKPAGVLGTIWCLALVFAAVELSYRYLELPVQRWAKARLRGERVALFPRPHLHPHDVIASDRTRAITMDARMISGALVPTLR